ncbi:ribonuclease H2 subunit C [Anopheles ziemanni]|uniref:ribonuclease H2 subunit C n=1 Tax=Anopheles coustani TaxID=139045 RepID=UPI002658E3FF|nr:ribonuclease H2 subunit C [Anopheles coustani]XP_058174335.1 ribonuclease H2 subunit C [Anopheles ziemanni]
MSINLKLTAQDVKTSIEDPIQLQYIPATIEGDGPANLEKFFTPYTDTLPDGTLQNALRGYPLLGKRKTLPEGYTGVILQETKKPLSSDEDRTLTFGGAFREFTYWNYDRNPSRNDPFEKALNWLQLAEVLHSDGQDELMEKQETNTTAAEKSIQENNGL